ncbi:glutathione S-transferase family protein [Falsiroseomonas sp. HC035]|uniref:glutathione S-transferase family protein n=1 Tax=Falsiroseomonas sp. HC035 TaxID=3390999 RepID=UPI003D31AFCB
MSKSRRPAGQVIGIPPPENPAMIEIIGFPQSNFVWAVRIACAEKGVPHSLVPRPPHHPEVTAIHPLGKVPVMRHGAVRLAESRAICLYLDHAFPRPALMPRGAAAMQEAPGLADWLVRMRARPSVGQTTPPPLSRP